MPSDRCFRDDLPTVHISRLRAIGVVVSSSTEAVIKLGDVELVVGIVHIYFPNGGSWSFALCPSCGKRARTLRLLVGQLHCSRCLVRRGVRGRLEPLSVKQRAEVMALRLAARLGSSEPERLKPHSWGTMERRKRFEARLARAEFIISRKSRRYRDVLIPEIEPEPIKKPKIKSIRKR